MSWNGSSDERAFITSSSRRSLISVDEYFLFDGSKLVVVVVDGFCDGLDAD